MTWVISICAVMLLISALLVLVRIEKGPTSLDRMVGVDVMTSIVLGALALLAALTRRADLLAVFVVVSVVGFLGSVAMARIARREDPRKRRILSEEEERAAQAAEEAAEEFGEPEEPVHDIDIGVDDTDPLHEPHEHRERHEHREHHESHERHEHHDPNHAHHDPNHAHHERREPRERHEAHEAHDYRAGGDR